MQEERFIRGHKGAACHSINRRGDMGYRSELVSVGIKEAKWISIISHIDTYSTLGRALRPSPQNLFLVFYSIVTKC